MPHQHATPHHMDVGRPCSSVQATPTPWHPPPPPSKPLQGFAPASKASSTPSSSSKKGAAAVGSSSSSRAVAAADEGDAVAEAGPAEVGHGAFSFLCLYGLGL